MPSPFHHDPHWQLYLHIWQDSTQTSLVAETLLSEVARSDHNGTWTHIAPPGAAVIAMQHAMHRTRQATLSF